MTDKFDKNELITKFKNQYKTPQQKAIEARKDFKTIEDKISDTVKEINYSKNLITNIANENKPIREKITEFMNNFKVRHFEDTEYHYVEVHPPKPSKVIKLKSKREHKQITLIQEILLKYIAEHGEFKHQMTRIVKSEILSELKIIKENEEQPKNMQPLEYDGSDILLYKTTGGFYWENEKGDTERFYKWQTLEKSINKIKKQIKEQL